MARPVNRGFDSVFQTSGAGYVMTYPPRLPNLRASHLIVRSARRILWNLFHFRSSSSEASSTEEDTKLKKVAVKLEQLQELQNYEGKTPEMSSVTRLISPQRGGILEGELGPYIPTSPVEDLSARVNADEPQLMNTSDTGAEEAVRATGEAHFGNAESADGWMTPFPVSGVEAESTDELTTPPPTTIQLEHSRPDLSPDLTDKKRTPAGAELMETAELKEFCPLADCQLDTAEDCLQPATLSISQDTRSSGAQATRKLPGQSTGSLDVQETGSPESQTAERSEAAIIASSTVHAPIHAAIYPNFGSISPIIITGDKSGEQLPMLNLDVMEESGSLERGSRETTITTNVAGTEPMTWTGHQYIQIPGTHVETDFEESGETSRKYDCFGHTVAPNTTAELEIENGNELANEQLEDLKTDLCGSRDEDDVIREREVRKQEDVANITSLPDARSDKPTSTMEVWSREEVRPTKPSLQEVLVDTTGLEPGGHAVDSGTSSCANVNDRKEPTVIGEEMPRH